MLSGSTTRVRREKIDLLSEGLQNIFFPTEICQKRGILKCHQPDSNPEPSFYSFYAVAFWPMPWRKDFMPLRKDVCRVILGSFRVCCVLEVFSPRHKTEGRKEVYSYRNSSTKNRVFGTPWEKFLFPILGK